MRSGGKSLVANCGYQHGYSVLEVIAAVERVVGKKLDVRMSGRRPGDAVAIVANVERCRAELGWTPDYDDLDTIVSHALQWEEMLRRRNR
jgi:UDP-glucose 4-epimerase